MITKIEMGRQPAGILKARIAHEIPNASERDIRKKDGNKTIIQWCLAFLVLLGNMPRALAQDEDSLQSLQEKFINIIEKAKVSAVTIEISCKGHQRIGSGLILEKEGYIVTVANFCNGGKEICARLISGEKFPARVVGIDARTNLAVLKIDARDLQAVDRGDSDQLQLAAFLFLVSNSYALKNSISWGIVSGLNRTVEDRDGPVTGLIQTDIPIGEGNIGALVVDSRGQFVGMAWAYSMGPRSEQAASLYKLLETFRKGDISDSQAVQMIQTMIPPRPPDGFILPSNTIYWVSDQIIRNGAVRRGWVGIEVVNHDCGKGVVVTNVLEGSPAARAGLKPYDYLLKIGDQPITNTDFLIHKISHSKVEDKITFTLLRDQKENTVVVKLASPP